MCSAMRTLLNIRECERQQQHMLCIESAKPFIYYFLTFSYRVPYLLRGMKYIEHFLAEHFREEAQNKEESTWFHSMFIC